jgi:hypothetical protein
MLIVSIMTKNGFNQSGAPPGSREAINLGVLNMTPEIIRVSHKISPSVKVKTKWLVILKL